MEFENLFTPWDKNGNRITKGQQVYYSVAQIVAEGTVIDITEVVPINTYGAHGRKLHIKDDDTKKKFILNVAGRCIIKKS